MVDTVNLTDARHALVEKYLRGELELPQTTPSASADVPPTQGRPVLPQDSRVSLIPIQTAGAKRPFFYVHVHWIGGAFYAFPLARDLGPDQPFCVLDPYTFDGLPVPPTIEAMAAVYIDAMRDVQPEGPYLLGGFCGGSLIAYEMAQQLRAQGQDVDLLVLIDPMAGPIRSLRIIGAVIRSVGHLLRVRPDQQVDWFLRLRYVSRVVRRACDENTEHVEGLMRRWRAEHARRFSLIPAAAALRQDWMAVFAWAVSGYRPRDYPGKITYLYARENPDSRMLWWGKATHESDNVVIHAIPGTHTTCRTDHLRDLAQHLRACLEQARQPLT